jgi:hypothetical protein
MNKHSFSRVKHKTNQEQENRIQEKHNGNMTITYNTGANTELPGKIN